MSTTVYPNNNAKHSDILIASKKTNKKNERPIIQQSKVYFTTLICNIFVQATRNQCLLPPRKWSGHSSPAIAVWSTLEIQVTLNHIQTLYKMYAFCDAYIDFVLFVCLQQCPVHKKDIYFFFIFSKSTLRELFKKNLFCGIKKDLTQHQQLYVVTALCICNVIKYTHIFIQVWLN